MQKHFQIRQTFMSTHNHQHLKLFKIENINDKQVVDSVKDIISHFK